MVHKIDCILVEGTNLLDASEMMIHSEELDEKATNSRSFPFYAVCIIGALVPNFDRMNRIDNELRAKPRI